MSVAGIIPGTKDYGYSENKYLQVLFPWLKQVNNSLVPKVSAADNSGQIGPTGYPEPGTFSSTPSAPAGGNGGSTGSQPTQQTQTTQQTTSNPTGAAADDVARREAQLRGEIDSGYSAFTGGLETMKSGLETDKTGELDSASKTYDTIFSGLGDQKKANLDKLESNKTAVNTRKATSIKDLQQNLQNTIRGASMQLGAAGAGDTSATRVMAPYAYGKLAGQQEGKIVTQANDQLFDIDTQEKDTETEFTKMWKDTEVQKEQQTQEIKNFYGNKIRNVQLMIAQAPLDKARELSALSTSLLQEARAKLTALETEDRKRKEETKTWATNRLAELDNMRITLNGKANFSPQDILWDELSVGGIPQTNGGMNYDDLVTAVRKKYIGQTQ